MTVTNCRLYKCFYEEVNGFEGQWRNSSGVKVFPRLKASSS